MASVIFLFCSGKKPDQFGMEALNDVSVDAPTVTESHDDHDDHDDPDDPDNHDHLETTRRPPGDQEETTRNQEPSEDQ